MPKERRMLQRDEQFFSLAHEIVTSAGYDTIRRLNHHDASLADHSVAVAYYAFIIARALGLRKNLVQLARGALLHDFFHYDWHVSKPRSGGLHGFDHPREALENAEAAYGPLSRLERDIVLRHMWPLTPIPPRYPESLIVCMVDKAVSIAESWRSIRSGKGLGVL